MANVLTPIRCARCGGVATANQQTTYEAATRGQTYATAIFHCGPCDREELVDLEPNTGNASQAEDFQTPYHRAIEPPRQYRAVLQACLHCRHLSAFVMTSDEQKSMPRTCPVCEHALLLW